MLGLLVSALNSHYVQLQLTQSAISAFRSEFNFIVEDAVINDSAK